VANLYTKHLAVLKRVIPAKTVRCVVIVMDVPSGKLYPATFTVRDTLLVAAALEG